MADWLIIVTLSLVAVGAGLSTLGVLLVAGAIYDAVTAPRRVRAILRQHNARLRAELDKAEAAAKAVRP